MHLLSSPVGKKSPRLTYHHVFTSLRRILYSLCTRCKMFFCENLPMYPWLCVTVKVKVGSLTIRLLKEAYFQSRIMWTNMNSRRGLLLLVYVQITVGEPLFFIYIWIFKISRLFFKKGTISTLLAVSWPLKVVLLTTTYKRAVVSVPLCKKG